MDTAIAGDAGADSGLATPDASEIDASAPDASELDAALDADAGVESDAGVEPDAAPGSDVTTAMDAVALDADQNDAADLDAADGADGVSVATKIRVIPAESSGSPDQVFDGVVGAGYGGRKDAGWSWTSTPPTDRLSETDTLI